MLQIVFWLVCDAAELIKLPSTKGQQMARETMTKDTELLKMI